MLQASAVFVVLTQIIRVTLFLPITTLLFLHTFLPITSVPSSPAPPPLSTSLQVMAALAIVFFLVTSQLGR